MGGSPPPIPPGPRTSPENRPGSGSAGTTTPEQWDAAVWAEDDVLMRQARVNTVTVGVFSWALLEPEEGQFEFGWLDATLDRLGCTRTGYA